MRLWSAGRPLGRRQRIYSEVKAGRDEMLEMSFRGGGDQSANHPWNSASIVGVTQIWVAGAKLARGKSDDRDAWTEDTER